MDDRPGDGRRFLLILLGAVWLMAFGYAFYSAATDQADSKTRAFLGWQGIAGIAAVALYGVGLAWEKGSAARNLSRWPLILAVLVALGTGGVFFVSGSL